MNYPLFFIIVSLLGAIYVKIGSAASKGVKTDDDYFLMGRKLTFFPLSLTLLATQLGGGTLLGASQEAYTKGWWVMFYPLGASLGLFALGMGFGGTLRNMNIATVAELFETIYGSRLQRLIASALSVAALFFILAAQGIAARLFFVAMGVENPLVFIAFWSILVAYTVVGGLKAVVNTDILQALFIIATLGIVFFSIDYNAVIPAVSPLMEQSTEAPVIPWSAWLLMPLLFMLIEQDMGQRCFAAKNTRVISLSSIAAGVTLLICSAIAIYFGILAKEMGITAPANRSILIEAVMTLTNPVVATFFMAAIFVAIISTADSLLCSISSNLSYDFLGNGQKESQNGVKIAQSLTLVTGILALGVAYLFDNVVTVLILSYELSVCLLFVPIAAAVFTSRPSWIGSYAAIVAGGCGFVFFRAFDVPFPKEIGTLALAATSYCIGAWVALPSATIALAKD